MGRLEDRLAALATMSPAQLRGEWLQTFGVAAPAVGHKLLALGLAHRLQEKALGGVPSHVAREIETLSRQIDRGGNLRPSPAAMLKPGTRLVREWRGATHQVLVLDDGFLWRDERHASLSGIAKQITGAHWSGPRFFGLGARTANGIAA